MKATARRKMATDRLDRPATFSPKVTPHPTAVEQLEAKFKALTFRPRDGFLIEPRQETRKP